MDKTHAELFEILNPLEIGRMISHCTILKTQAFQKTFCSYHN